MARLKEQYKAEVAPALYKKFGYKSTMQIPKIDKVVVNVGCGEAKENAKVLEAVVRDLTTITGQKAIITIAHRLATVQNADQILVLDQGRIVQQGTHEELLGEPDGKYYELWNAQAQYYTEESA